MCTVPFNLSSGSLLKLKVDYKSMRQLSPCHHPPLSSTGKAAKQLIAKKTSMCQKLKGLNEQYVVINTQPSQESIDSLANYLNSHLTSPAQKCGMQRNVIRCTMRKLKENQCFNKECHKKRREYQSYKNKVNKNKLTRTYR